MPNQVRVLTVLDADRAELQRRVRDRRAPARVAERARIVLLSADGLTGPQIAAAVGCSEPTVVKWRGQYAGKGLAGLEDAPRGGGPVTVLTEETVHEVLAATLTPPPDSSGGIPGLLLGAPPGGPRVRPTDSNAESGLDAAVVVADVGKLAIVAASP